MVAEGDGKGGQTGAQIACMCYCSGWAMIHVRRPTGDTCWMTRVLNPPQSVNDVFLLSDWSEEPAPNLAALFTSKNEPTTLSLDEISDTGGHPKLDRSVSASAVVSSPPCGNLRHEIN